MFRFTHAANKLQMITATEITVIKFLKTYGNRTRNARFCDAITINYDKMALKFFINTVEKHVKRQPEQENQSTYNTCKTV